MPQSSRLDELRDSAAKRLGARRNGKSRVAVQVGHCSQSVGAADVAASVETILPDDAYLVVTGCDGACFQAPKVTVATSAGGRSVLTNASPESARSIFQKANETPSGDDFLDRQLRIALDGCGELDPTDVDDYIARGGYAGLAKALTLSPAEVIEEVKASGLRGRGGAYFPAAVKWEGARSTPKEPRYLVVNCEEGEPGVFKDRHLMEGVPHRILEGAAIAAYASGVSRAYLYVNAEAELSADRMRQAVESAYELGLLGRDILCSGFDLEMEIRRGAGGYVCGEETTLLNTMEGDRREPRLRPPFPTQSGFRASPTVINNTETLCSVPFVMTNGTGAFADIGTADYPGTKIISLSGSVRRPGVAEVPMGTSLREIVYGLGGGPPDGRPLTALAVGGPSSGLLPGSMLDTPIRGGLLHEAGVMLGAGGVIAIDSSVTVVEALRSLVAYNADESCGKCTPCREGTPRMVDAVERIASGSGSSSDIDELLHLAEVVNAASLCGLGQAAGNPATSALRLFGAELAKATAGAGGGPAAG